MVGKARPPVLVINRDQDTARLARFSSSAARYGVMFERVPALDAHAPDFPFADHGQLIADHFWGQPDAKPGAIGCFLSHRAAWQRVLDKGLPLALICEDDAVFLRPPDLDAEDAELVFANRRLASWAAAVGGDAEVAKVIPALADLGGPKACGLKPAPGGDCYLLTDRGAARLLDLTGAQGITCGVDWAMIWHCLGAVTDQMTSAFPELGILRQHHQATTPPLDARILLDPVADQSGDGGSTIKHAITRPISDLRQV